MDRQFYPPFYPYYPYYPYYRPRRFFPFFFIFPFGRRRRPYYRDDERDQSLTIEHKCVEGESIKHLCREYNVPQPILLEMNPHLQQSPSLKKGDIVHIPRMDEIYCQRMFMEEDDFQMSPGMHPPGFDPMMQGMGGMPHMGGMPGMSGMPGMGGMPGMDGMPGMSGMPGMGGMPDMNGMPGMGGMADMPGAQGPQGQ